MNALHLYNVQKVRVDLKIPAPALLHPPTPHHAPAVWSTSKLCSTNQYNTSIKVGTTVTGQMLKCARYVLLTKVLPLF